MNINISTIKRASRSIREPKPTDIFRICQRFRIHEKAAKTLFILLDLHARGAYKISNAELADKAGCSLSAIKRHLKLLTEKGLLVSSPDCYRRMPNGQINQEIKSRLARIADDEVLAARAEEAARVKDAIAKAREQRKQRKLLLNQRPTAGLATQYINIPDADHSRFTPEYLALLNAIQDAPPRSGVWS